MTLHRSPGPQQTAALHRECRARPDRSNKPSPGRAPPEGGWRHFRGPPWVDGFATDGRIESHRAFDRFGGGKLAAHDFDERDEVRRVARLSDDAALRVRTACSAPGSRKGPWAIAPGGATVESMPQPVAALSDLLPSTQRIQGLLKFNQMDPAGGKRALRCSVRCCSSKCTARSAGCARAGSPWSASRASASERCQRNPSRRIHDLTITTASRLNPGAGLRWRRGSSHLKGFQSWSHHPLPWHRSALRVCAASTLARGSFSCSIPCGTSRFSG